MKIGGQPPALRRDFVEERALGVVQGVIRDRARALGVHGKLARHPPLAARELADAAVPHRLLHPLIGVEEPERHPARVGKPGKRGGDLRNDRADRGLDFRRMLLNPERRGLDLAGRDPMDGSEELGHADAVARRSRDHRHAERVFQLLDVDADAVALRLVHQVETDHDPVGDLEHLQREIEVPLEPRGIEDHHRHVGPAEQNEIPGNFLVGAAGLEGVGARQVHDLHPRSGMLVLPFGAGHRLPGPVAGVLPEPGQRIEDRALPRVRIAGEGDEVVPLVGPPGDVHQRGDGGMRDAAAAMRGAGGGRSDGRHATRSIGADSGRRT